ncbi:hypothetical protein [Streptomyces caatingaensis]|nr:hypothetical protein [Streptomyces caatingaensis]
MNTLRSWSVPAAVLLGAGLLVAPAHARAAAPAGSLYCCDKAVWSTEKAAEPLLRMAGLSKKKAGLLGAHCEQVTGPGGGGAAGCSGRTLRCTGPEMVQAMVVVGCRPETAHRA